MNSTFIHSASDLLALAWRPFVTPALVWNWWWLLIIPLVAGVAVVYKSTKCRRPEEIPLGAFPNRRLLARRIVTTRPRLRQGERRHQQDRRGKGQELRRPATRQTFECHVTSTILKGGE